MTGDQPDQPGQSPLSFETDFLGNESERTPIPATLRLELELELVRELQLADQKQAPPARLCETKRGMTMAVGVNAE